jgi:hypothetical protein
MKKLFLLASFVVMGFAANAQVLVEETNINELDVKFVELIGRNKVGFGKIKVIVDYGQKISWLKSQAIRSADGTKAAFNSMIDALNFMDANGWDFVSNYVIPATTEGGNNEVRYILVKRK